METLTWVQLKNSIACGKYQCLHGCCDADELRSIWALMHRLSEYDVATLAGMLCCATSNAAAAPDTRNCYQRIRDYACQHEDMLTALPAVLTGITAFFPGIAEYTVPAAAIAAEIASDCHVGSPADESVMSKFVQAVCYFNGLARSVREKIVTGTPEVVKPVVEAIDKWLVGLVTFDFCCPSGSQSTMPTLPAPPIIPTPGLPPVEPPLGLPPSSKCGSTLATTFKMA